MTPIAVQISTELSPHSSTNFDWGRVETDNVSAWLQRDYWIADKKFKGTQIETIGGNKYFIADTLETLMKLKELTQNGRNKIPAG